VVCVVEGDACVGVWLCGEGGGVCLPNHFEQRMHVKQAPSCYRGDYKWSVSPYLPACLSLPSTYTHTHTHTHTHTPICQGGVRQRKGKREGREPEWGGGRVHAFTLTHPLPRVPHTHRHTHTLLSETSH